MTTRSRSVSRDPVGVRSSSPVRQNPQALLAQSQRSDQTMRDFLSAQLALQQVKPFHGRPGSDPADFLDQLRFAFEQSPLGLEPEENKVRRAISYLRDKAREWIQP